MTRGIRFAALLVGLAGFLVPLPAQPSGDEPETVPETVMVTLRAKSGAEAELERVITQHWETAHRLKLVTDAPHMTVRGSDAGGKTYFVHIFTWRDARVPDSAPSEIQRIWGEMNRLVEPRGGRPGLEFTAVSLVLPHN